MTRVLVTRPEPGASATADRLIELGFKPVILPLTETRPLAISEPPTPEAFDAVVATSSAALRHMPPGLLRGLSGLPLFAVGKASAEMARRAGFASAESAHGDAPALAALVARSLPAGSWILYLCGRVRTGALAERLREQGYCVTAVETYDTLPMGRTAGETAAALGGQPVDAALLYSANAATLFAPLLASRGIGALLRAARLLCISGRTAGALPPAARGRAEIATTPDEAGLFRLLRASD